MFEEIATYTNMYGLQLGLNSFRLTSTSEIKILFALHIMIGSLNKFPRIRMYWERSLRIYAFLENMSRDRFFQLRTCLHFVNNLEKPTKSASRTTSTLEGSPSTSKTTSESNPISKSSATSTSELKDKLYKVRPIIESVRKRCLQLEVERDLSVDEQIIPFTGKIGIKQYIRGKPCPWGIKVYVLCGKSGQAYDFLFYQGKSTEINKETLTKFGHGASVVLHLIERISKSGHHLFFDNFFSSYLLFTELKDKGILAAGTIRINRFFQPPIMNDKEMKKKERGFSEEVVSPDGIVIVKWLDNRTVCLASNYLGKGEEDTAKRWDKNTSKYIEITRPAVVKEYNHSMGGVDLLDQLISLYRIFIRSRKWTLRVTMHMVDFALVNSWIEYKKDCEKNNITGKNVIDLLEFRMRVAESLIKMGQAVILNKRGRPPTSNSPRNSPSNSPVPSRRRVETRPLREIQSDRVDHMPQFDDQKEATRCKKTGCKGRTHVFCDKCKVHLCLLKIRNCYSDFHRK